MNATPQPMFIVPSIPGVDGVRAAQMLPYSQVQRRPSQWLWPGRSALGPGRIAAGKVTLLVGESGLGKSSVAADLAARVSKGSPWPEQDNANTSPGTALVISSAEEYYDLMPARLEGAGADLDRICTIQPELFEEEAVNH